MDLTTIPQADLIAELERRRNEINKSLDGRASCRFSSRQMQDINTIFSVVCEVWDIHEEIIFQDSHSPLITQPRQAAMVIIRRMLGLTLEDVGAIFSKDHGTVIHACKNHEARLQNFPNYRDNYHRAHQRIQESLNS